MSVGRPLSCCTLTLVENVNCITSAAVCAFLGRRFFYLFSLDLSVVGVSVLNIPSHER